jgi:predicted CXXCH cytochrome family protein
VFDIGEASLQVHRQPPESATESMNVRGLQERRLLALLPGVLFFAEATADSIRGSPHDFSANQWSGSEICVACHTPHGAGDQRGTPLWNHTSSTATFTLYASATLHGTVNQPGAQSLSCLSCHDGTVAVDAFGGATGSQFISMGNNIGTGLGNDHPVGIKMRHESGINCATCHNMHATPSMVSELPFFQGRVECATCHDPHNNGQSGGKFLRKPITGSALCKHCHAK